MAARYSVPVYTSVVGDSQSVRDVRLADVLTNDIAYVGSELPVRVAVQVEKSPQAVFLYLACLRIGAVYLPLNTAYTGAELAYFIDDADPAVIFDTPTRFL